MRKHLVALFIVLNGCGLYFLDINQQSGDSTAGSGGQEGTKDTSSSVGGTGGSEEEPICSQSPCDHTGAGCVTPGSICHHDATDGVFKCEDKEDTCPVWVYVGQWVDGGIQLEDGGMSCEDGLMSCDDSICSGDLDCASYIDDQGVEHLKDNYCDTVEKRCCSDLDHQVHGSCTLKKISGQDCTRDEECCTACGHTTPGKCDQKSNMYPDTCGQSWN